MFVSVESSLPDLSNIILLQYLNANTLKEESIPYLQRILWKSNHNTNLKYRMNTFSGNTMKYMNLKSKLMMLLNDASEMPLNEYEPNK